MTYLPEEFKVIYRSKTCSRRRSGNGKEKIFDALERLAAMSFHVPDWLSLTCVVLSFRRKSSSFDSAQVQ